MHGLYEYYITKCIVSWCNVNDNILICPVVDNLNTKPKILNLKTQIFFIVHKHFHQIFL